MLTGPRTTEMLETLIVRWGYLAVVLGTFFEGEAVLVLAGALAHRGLLSLPLVMLSATIGSVAGDQLWFQLGRRFGQPLIDRRPAWSALVDRVRRRLDRYGSAFVVGFRFLYGIRSVTPALLGISGYPSSRFACLNLAGGAAWAAAVGTAGWALGAALTNMLQRAAHVEELLGVGVVTALIFALGWKWLRHRRLPNPKTQVVEGPTPEQVSKS
jgi:membrane protein DedA with SNARE-associated domain